MAKVWFISDTHFSHFNSIRYSGRPFFTKRQMDEAIIRNWNKVVAPEDTVYHLGDVAMSAAPIKRILPRLKGHKILIVGNHDLNFVPHFLKTRGQKFVDRMTKEYTEAGFSKIYPSGLEYAIWSDHSAQFYHVRLCHFPTKNAFDSHGLKHWDSRPEDTGILNICGHIHSLWKKRGNNINVGVDAFNFTPVLLEEVYSLWQFGEKNIDIPHKWRIAIWKAYHTVIWKITGLFKKSPPKRPQKMVG